MEKKYVAISGMTGGEGTLNKKAFLFVEKLEMLDKNYWIKYLR